MKLIYVLVGLMLIRIASFAQGIKFEQELTWEQVLQKAKTENKYIFVDCYTSWCGPCKWMSKNIFTQKKVGDFFNEHFINVAIQMDKTANDTELTKNWYDEAKTIETKYSVAVYPSYLFFSPDGNIVHRFSGSTGENPQDFIDRSRDALLNEKQYYRSIKEYLNHTEDPVFLKQALSSAIQKGDQINSLLIAKYYLDMLNDSLPKEDLLLLSRTISSSSDPVFRFFLKNMKKIDESTNHQGFAKFRLIDVILNEEVDPILADSTKIMDHTRIAKLLKYKYPSLGEELVKSAKSRAELGIESQLRTAAWKEDINNMDWNKIFKEDFKRFRNYDNSKIKGRVQMQYYQNKKNWPACEQAAFRYLRKYGRELSDREVNNITWLYIFLHGSDRTALKEAIKWQKLILEQSPETAGFSTINNTDTYANLLYKLGDVDSAIAWEEKAIKEMQAFYQEYGKYETYLKDYRANLEKMKKGEKTWIEP